MLSILAGFSLDSLIARRIGAKGYGAIMGAGIGNALADTVAGLPEGRHAAVGVGLGALVPLTPIITAMLLRKELTGRVAYAVGASSATLFVGTFVHSYLQPDEEETD
ncbi:N-acetyl-anhydromuranmyl-L-alanine amidase, variant 2 [Balamuthia mandrillaris]